MKKDEKMLDRIFGAQALSEAADDQRRVASGGLTWLCGGVLLSVLFLLSRLGGSGLGIAFSFLLGFGLAGGLMAAAGRLYRAVRCRMRRGQTVPVKMRVRLTEYHPESDARRAG